MTLSIHQYLADEKVEMREVTPNHFVYCSEKEYKRLKEKYSS